MSVYKNCVNCGTQNITDEQYNPTDRCIHCGKPIGVKVDKKEDPMGAERQEETIKTTPLPPAEEASQEQILAPIYEGKPHKYRRGIRKWGRICKACDFSYLHDDQPRCSSKKCPKHCPPALRPFYRAKEAPPRATPKKNEKKTPVILQTIPKTLEDAEEVCERCPVVQAFKGYRLAVNDILGSLKRSKGEPRSEQ